MVDLTRAASRDILKASTTANLTLLLAKGLPSMSDDITREDASTVKSEFLARIAGTKRNKLYEKVFKRWEAITADRDRFDRMKATVEGRLMVGHSAGNSVETSIALQHVYGVPYIPGSSIKGLARKYATDRRLPGKVIAALFGADDEIDGVAPGAGCVIWHDAWWDTATGGDPLELDIVTVHHPDYYQGGGMASDMDSPVPNAQLAARGKFLFVLEGDAQWTELALGILRKALMYRGIGSKTAAGYGVLAASDQDFVGRKQPEVVVEDPLQKHRESLARLEKTIASMDEKKIYETFGAKRKGNIRDLSAQYGIDEPAIENAITDYVISHHKSVVESWQSAGKQDKNKKKAYSFFMGGKDDD